MRGEIMFWLLIALVLAFSIAVPRFRRAGLIFVGIVIVTVVVVIAITQHYHERAGASDAGRGADSTAPSRRVDLDQIEWERLDRQDPQAKSRIAPAMVHFDQIRPLQGSLPQTIEAVQARLYNDSPQYLLTHYAYYLVVQDCVGAECTTVYDQRGRAAQSIPPQQARDVTLEIRDPSAGQGPPFRFLGTPRILLSVAETRAVAAP